jgi:hypothetical protein
MPLATSFAAAEPSARMVNDHCPVMQDEPASPQHEVQFRGYAVRFCCDKCKDKFADDPVPYLSYLPQLPSATIYAAVADAQRKAHGRQAAGFVDRWFEPAVLAAATLLAGLVALRVIRRVRRVGAGNAPHVPY